MNHIKDKWQAHCKKQDLEAYIDDSPKEYLTLYVLENDNNTMIRSNSSIDIWNDGLIEIELCNTEFNLYKLFTGFYEELNKVN